MRTSTKVLCAAVAAAGLLGVASASQASITVTWVNVGTPTDTPVSTSTVMTGYTAYLVQISCSPSDGNITAYDIGGLNGTGITPTAGNHLYAVATHSGIFNTPKVGPSVNTNDATTVNPGVNNAVADYGPGDNPSLSILTSTNVIAGYQNYGSAILDSYKNYAVGLGTGTSDMVQGAAATGTGFVDGGTPITETSSVKLGTITALTGAFGISNQNGAQQSTFDIAYVVVKNTDVNPLQLSGAVACTNATYGSVTSELITATPEPASIGLLALGGLALLARRRKA